MSFFFLYHGAFARKESEILVFFVISCMFSSTSKKIHICYHPWAPPPAPNVLHHKCDPLGSRPSFHSSVSQSPQPQTPFPLSMYCITYTQSGGRSDDLQNLFVMTSHETLQVPITFDKVHIIINKCTIICTTSVPIYLQLSLFTNISKYQFTLLHCIFDTIKSVTMAQA